MALDYTTDVLPHLVEGDDAATRDAINANLRHVRDAAIEPFRRVLLDSGMIIPEGFEGYGGIIAGLYGTLQDSGKVVADQFLTDVRREKPYPSSTHEGGQRIQQVIGLAQQNEASLLGGYTAASFAEAMTGLTGGRKYGSVTTQEVTDAIAAHAAKVARQDLVDEYETLMGQNVQPADQSRAEIVAGLRAVADALEAA